MYVTNLVAKQSKGTLSIILFIARNTAVFFDSLEIEQIPQEVLNKIKEDKLITRTIFRIQSDGSIMCGFYWVAFIEYIIAGRNLLDYTNLFSPDDYRKNNKITYKCFEDKYGKRKHT